MKSAAYWIEQLHLGRHPEGGYFRKTYTSAAKMGECCLGSDRAAPRPVSTAIYYLLDGTEFSALHRIKSDEIWHHYAGSSLTIHIIDVSGIYREVALGKDPDEGETLQAVVPAGSWFGATVDDHSSYSLVGCTVAPGFDFREFEMGRRGELIHLYPDHRRIIESLTH
jgi:hypothetical protein